MRARWLAALALLATVIASTACTVAYETRCDRVVGYHCYDVCRTRCLRYSCYPVCYEECDPICENRPRYQPASTTPDASSSEETPDAGWSEERDGG
jgi:hypothetical protein